MSLGNQIRQKIVNMQKRFATPRTRELERQSGELYRQFGLLQAELKRAQTRHQDLLSGLDGYDRQFETLNANVEARQSVEQALREAISQLKQQAAAVELELTRAKEEKKSLGAELDRIRDDIAHTHGSHAEQMTLLQQQIADIGANGSTVRSQLKELESMLAETVSRQDDTKREITMLEGGLEGERQRHDADRNTVEGQLTRLQKEQEHLLKTQLGISNSVRKNYRWAAVAFGIAVLAGVIAGVTRYQETDKDLTELAALTHEPAPVPEKQSIAKAEPVVEEPVTGVSEAVESAALEPEALPAESPGPVAAEPPAIETRPAPGKAPVISVETAGSKPDAGEPVAEEIVRHIEPSDTPPDVDVVAAVQRPLTPGQATAALQDFGSNAYFKENAGKEGVVSLPSGLQYKILKQGTGQSPGPQDMVILHYRGSLPDGRVFDSSYKENAPAAYRVDEVIAGWREALLRMREGAQWELYIPPELAHGAGAGGAHGFLPLIYRIELISVSKTGAS